MFAGTGLASVTIPEDVSSIGDGAFRDCDGLTSITIPQAFHSEAEISPLGLDESWADPFLLPDGTRN